MKHFSKRWTIVYTTVLLAFSLYAVLDTFVISSVYTVVEQGQTMPENTENGTAKGTTKNSTKKKDTKGTAKVHAEESEAAGGTQEASGKKHEKGGGKKGGGEAQKGETTESEPKKNQTTESNSAENKTTGNESTGNKTTGNKTTGNKTTGNKTTGNKTTGNKTTENGNTRNKITGNESVGNGNSENENTENKTTQKPTKSSGAESQISLTEYREYDTDIYVAQIDTSSVVALRTAFAQGAYGRNVTAKTSETAESVGAVLAINGDYYGTREQGYVIRNGVLYRDEGKAGQEDLVIYQDGIFVIIKEDEITAEELVAQGAWQVWSFGPALIENGEISVDTTDEVDKAMQDNPRTAIGILENGDYVMVVSDGRTSESEGLSLYELAAFMKSLGAVTAYNLDGGGSSTMVYNGELVNNPTTTGRIKERAVSDIVYIAY